jgi:hypothetical protein
MMETVAILFHLRISPHPFSAESLLLSPIRLWPPAQASGWISKPTQWKKSYFLLLILWLTTCARKFGRQVRQWIRACSSRIFSQQRALSFPQCSLLTYEVEIRSFIQLMSERWPLTSLLEDPGINSSLSSPFLSLCSSVCLSVYLQLVWLKLIENWRKWIRQKDIHSTSSECPLW